MGERGEREREVERGSERVGWGENKSHKIVNINFVWHDEHVCTYNAH